MRARHTATEHRVATPLELLFDLCFVVAVAFAAERLHHTISENHPGQGAVAYLMVFFGIWWAWMNFTWFASAYDTDDVPYRLATFVQIAGVLVVAAGVPRAFDSRNFAVVVLGYAIMRLGLCAQWLRAALTDPAGRASALRYAAGIVTCTVGWCALLVIPRSAVLPVFVLLGLAELAVPVWAERPRATPWHPRHIAERFGLFVIIVLGETVLAATVAVQSALDAGASRDSLVALAIGGLVIVFAMWWVYFDQPAHRILVDNRHSFVWGYGHFLIFASAAAVGAGLAATVDHQTHHAAVPRTVASLAVAVPVAVFLVFVWALHVRPHRRGGRYDSAFLIAAALVLLAVASPFPIPTIAAVLAALVAAGLALATG